MLGVRLDADTEQALDRFAHRSRRSKSDIAREAIKRYVRQNNAKLAAEAKFQSLRAAARGWTAEDEAWSELAAANDATDSNSGQ
jgi:RHH-type transcriptional regulator, rel operon repressor / antitoxin RelB